MIAGEVVQRLCATSARLAGLRLLIVHGSVARGDQRPGSDLDLGYLADDAFDPAAAHAELTRVAARDDLDLVDLQRASAVLRFRAARDGVVLFEREPEAFLDFAEEAVRFYSDAGWVLARAQQAVLEALG